MTYKNQSLMLLILDMLSCSLPSPKKVCGFFGTCSACRKSHERGSLSTCAAGETTNATPSSSLRRNRSEEHTSELQSHSDLVCRLLLEKKKKHQTEDASGKNQTEGHAQSTLGRDLNQRGSTQ